MRIAFVSTIGECGWGGSEELWAHAAGQACRQGHDVDAYLWRSAEPRPKLADLQRMGLRVHQYPPPTRPVQTALHRFLVRHPSMIQRLGRWGTPLHRLLASRPDAVCLSLGDTYVLAMHFTFRMLVEQLIDRSIPYVVICHSTPPQWTPPRSTANLASRFFKHARAVAFVSQAQISLVREHLGDAAPPDPIVLRNPVNLTDANPAPWPEPEPWRLAFVGHLHLHDKGLDVLLKSLATDAWRKRHFQLRLFGGGRDEGAVRQLINQLDLADRVQLAGHVDDIRAVWADHHLQVMSSLREGTPLVMVEAMLCGRPGVFTDVGGITEWVQDDVQGFIAPEATVESFSQALERAWQARDRWPAMGQAAHQRAQELYDPNPGQTLLDLMLDADNC